MKSLLSLYADFILVLAGDLMQDGKGSIAATSPQTAISHMHNPTHTNVPEGLPDRQDLPMKGGIWNCLRLFQQLHSS